jgi:hypothetical protein
MVRTIASCILDFFQEHARSGGLSLVIKIGGFVESLYQIKCFEMPTENENLPLDLMGILRLEYHTNWYQNRQAIETARHESARCLQSTAFSEPSRVLVNETKRMSNVPISNPATVNERCGSSSTQAIGSIVEKKLEPLIPYDYEPHENAVLVCEQGTSRMCQEACGNMRLQSICKTFATEYARDTGRKGKSDIVSKIMEMVQV